MRFVTQPDDQRAKPADSDSGFRVMLYSHDTFGLGHIIRNLKIAASLESKYPGTSILIATGSPEAHHFRFPRNVDCVRLPAVQKIGDDKYMPRYLPLSMERLLAVRRAMLLEIVREYMPHILIVDHSPLGMNREMLPALKWINDGNTDTVPILGLRDIFDEPSTVMQKWVDQGVYDAMRNLYSRILIYGVKSVFDPIAEYDFPPDIESKTSFCGYVADSGNDTIDFARNDSPGRGKKVLVTIGGGDGGEIVIDNFIKAVSKNQDKCDFKSVILTGPFISPELERRFVSESRGLPVEIISFTADAAPYFKYSDLVISTGGYNTITDILFQARRAIVVPRIKYRQEQYMRARRFDGLGLVRMIHPDDLTPESLFEGITTKLGEKSAPLRDLCAEMRIDLDGGSRVAEIIGGLLEKNETLKEAAE